jgi:cardiolipin synthase
MSKSFAHWVDQAETELALKPKGNAKADASAWTLLEGSRDFFPALCQAFAQAKTRIWLETYILNEHGGTQAVLQALAAAAQRGVQVRVVMDGYGTPQLGAQWQALWQASGVQWRTYKPLGLGGLWFPSRWRRLHRKLCVVDDDWAFCGGINLIDDMYDPIHQQELQHPRLDFSVRLTGDLVSSVARVMEELWWRMDMAEHLREREVGQAMERIRLRDWHRVWRKRVAHGLRTLVLRDNLSHRSDIVRAYLAAIGRAREEIWIANAFFMPSGRVRRALIHACRRGVKVRLLVQGRFEYALPYRATRHLYAPLLAAGVEIWEYHASYLHGKVAVVDERWVTVGSSNLDPLSLLLAREANVVSRLPQDAQSVKQALSAAMVSGAKPIAAQQHAQLSRWERTLDALTWLSVRFAVWITARRY